MAPNRGAFSKIVLTDTTSTALVVGGANGASTTGTGGVVGGQVALTKGIAIDGGTISDHGIVMPSAVPAVTTAALYNDAGTLKFDGAAVSGGTVSGTTGKLAKFTAATAVGDSIITESGATISVAGSITVVGDNLILGANFLSGDGGDEGISVASDGVVSASSSIKERGRSVALGEWANQTFAAGDYTSSTNTWTVAAGDVTTNRYMLVGKTVTWQIVLITTTIGTGGQTGLRVAVPGGLTEAALSRAGVGNVSGDNSVNATVCKWAMTGAGYVEFTVTGGTWSSSTDTTALSATIIFEIT